MVKLGLYLCYFIESDWGSCIAFLTAGSATSIYVAAETLCDNVGVDNDITHHKHGWQMTVTYHCIGSFPD